MKAISASSGREIQYRAPGDNRHSEIISHKPDQTDLTNKIAIHKRRDVFVGQVLLRSKEAIKE